MGEKGGGNECQWGGRGGTGPVGGEKVRGRVEKAEGKGGRRVERLSGTAPGGGGSRGELARAQDSIGEDARQ